MKNLFYTLLQFLLFGLYCLGMYVIISDDHNYATKDVVIAAIFIPYPMWVGGKEIYKYITVPSIARRNEHKCLNELEFRGVPRKRRIKICKCFIINSKRPELCLSDSDKTVENIKSDFDKFKALIEKLVKMESEYINKVREKYSKKEDADKGYIDSSGNLVIIPTSVEITPDKIGIKRKSEFPLKSGSHIELKDNVIFKGGDLYIPTYYKKNCSKEIMELMRKYNFYIIQEFYYNNQIVFKQNFNLKSCKNWKN